MTLLTGVVVIVALSVGAVIVAQYSGDDVGPTTDLEVSADATDLRITHNGGDSLDLAALTVRLDQDGTESSFTPTAADATGPDDRLDPSERVELAHGLSAGDVDVIVVHRRSNTILLDERLTVPA